MYYCYVFTNIINYINYISTDLRLMNETIFTLLSSKNKI